jgi:thiopurine S-methyltransferase
MEDLLGHNNFWLNKWTSNAMGFHEDCIHPLLKKYWSATFSTTHRNVLVPLCGKSKDLLYLRTQGHNVLGIEISEIAITAFFTENKLKYERTQESNHAIFHAEGLTIYCADMLNFPQIILPKIDMVYDRAALIALSYQQRRTYSGWLTEAMETGCKSLVITLTYDESKFSPPPYLVNSMELSTLYQDNWNITHLGQHAATAKGHEANEEAYLLLRK